MNDAEWKVIDRFKEPSSWAAISVPLATMGLVVPTQWLQVISLVGSGLCVVLGIVLKEKSGA